MEDRFKFRIPMLSDKGNFCEFQYLELGDWVECSLCGSNGEPEQCTGLKDKNGKLIYEKDILKQSDGIIDVIQWFQGCYIYNGIGVADYLPLYQGEIWATDSKSLEIIGNIYENNDLLNA